MNQDNSSENNYKDKLDKIRMKRLDLYRKAIIFAVGAFFVSSIQFLFILLNGMLNIISLAMFFFVLALSAKWWQCAKYRDMGIMDYLNLLDREDWVVYKRNLEDNYPVIVHQYAAPVFILIYILLTANFLQYRPVSLLHAEETVKQIQKDVTQLETTASQLKSELEKIRKNVENLLKLSENGEKLDQIEKSLKSIEEKINEYNIETNKGSRNLFIPKADTKPLDHTDNN